MVFSAYGGTNEKPALLCIFLFILTCQPAVAQYPEIREMRPADLLYRQLHADIETFYRNAAQGQEMMPLQIYAYSPDREMSIFSLASSANLPYETIITLNRLQTRKEIRPGEQVLLPNMPGLFIPLVPQNELELLISGRLTGDLPDSMPVKIIDNGSLVDFLFIPGIRFTKLELAYFLGILFHFPLPIGKISSLYGMRNSPVSGKLHFHNGIDIAAPLGTDVSAAREGVVTETGWDYLLGNYIIIQHPGDYETVYGHLMEVLVELNQTVHSGMIIARLGNTGVSTGPHLHF